MTIQACISFQFPDQFPKCQCKAVVYIFLKKGEQQDRQLREREESLLFFFSLSPPDCWCGLLSIGNMCWPYVRKRSALPAHHSLRISAGVYRRRHTNMAYYIYKRGRKGGVPSSVADGRHTRDRGCPSYFFVVFSSPFSFPRLIFFLFFFFYLCAAVPTGHVFYNGEHRTSKQQCPSIQA